MNEKFFSLKNKTENFINLSAKINEEIKITKFDLALLLNQDPTKILNSNKESISSARKEIQENIILQKAKKLIKSSKKKENSENLLPYLQNPKNLNKHRVIHSMKLEINTKILEEKMVKTQRNRRIIRIRSLSYCNNKSNKKILQEKRKSYDFESLAERKSKQDKSLLPKNKTICTNSIYKLKEENIPYSSLFSFRMGKNSPKNQEITLFETLNNIGCEKNVILDEIIEQKNFLQTKEKCIVFDFQILMMLMITLIFTIIKKEVQLVVKITVWPFKILTYMNGFIMGRFLSRKN